MTIAERFSAALHEAADPDLGAPALLPERLARVCARILPVDGAGLSADDGRDRRLPLGASDPVASLAERLQFTAGSGPCGTAQHEEQPVFAPADDLERRWPAFAALLLEQTPYRGVVALPFVRTLAGAGALDLYFTDDSAIPSLDVFEAMAVADLVATELAEAAVWSTWPAGQGPAWLQAPQARQRSAVWEGLGRLSLALDVDVPAALDLLRAAAWSAGRLVDDLAAEVADGRLDPARLRPADDLGPGGNGHGA
ncbi:serine/threonine-protein kinase [Geodermatophilus marinus]|uniref:GAF domain-containing protein n=1 Tax=Geodermatophilus sp. LHW52908 TaxID=2303986 RepID=UPI000E3CC539|nr:GAF domain-containing protein [Geodermatophilus sp. LHW52908]RFU22996.1 GAF domain-containing protein [Geodermatophilus sp. LHW52908]